MNARESDKHMQMKKGRRRPEIEIYKPGMGLRKKDGQKSNCNINRTKDDTRCNHNEDTNSVHSYVNHNGKNMGDIDDTVSINLQKDKSSSENQCSRKLGRKRPDRPIYIVPKRRLMACIVNNSKDCSEDKHTELQSVVSKLSDGEQSEPIIGTRITPSRECVKISQEIHKSKQEQHAIDVTKLGIKENKKLPYVPMIKDSAEEIEAYERMLEGMDDGSSL